MDFLIDTTFLIDLYRDAGLRGPAAAWMSAHEETALHTTWISRHEFLRGALATGQDGERVRAFLDAFPTVYPTAETVETASRLWAELRKAHALIGSHDLWIAACAQEKDVPLLTRNLGEFQRVKSLRVVPYAGRGA